MARDKFWKGEAYVERLQTNSLIDVFVDQNPRERSTWREWREGMGAKKGGEGLQCASEQWPKPMGMWDIVLIGEGADTGRKRGKVEWETHDAT